MDVVKFSFLIFSLLPIFAGASNLAAKNYVVLEFIADEFLDTTPRFISSPMARPASVPIKATKEYAEARLYFAPRIPRAPVYLAVKYNFRKENHTWVNYDTGLRWVELVPAAEENRFLIEAAKDLAVQAKKFGVPADFSEPPFDSSHTLAMTSNRSNAELPERVEQMYEVLNGKSASLEEIGLRDDVAFSYPTDSEGGLGVVVRAQLSAAYAKPDDDPRKSVFIKRRYNGLATTRNLNDQEIVSINQLSLLMNCNASLKTKKTKLN